MTDIETGARLDDAPELRLVPYAFEQVFGEPPAGVWRAPAGITLLGAPHERLALALPLRWGAIVAAGAHPEGCFELRSMNRPALRYTATMAAPAGPAWTEPVMAVVRARQAAGLEAGGLRFLLHTDLPGGCGLPGADVALLAASMATFDGVGGASVAPGAVVAEGDGAALLASLACPDDAAVLVDRQTLTAEELAFDLGAARLRLMLVDLGNVPGRQPARPSTVDAGEAADRLRHGDLAGFGGLLGQPTHVPADVGAVAAALAGAGALGVCVPQPSPAPGADAHADTGACLVALVPADALGAARAAARRVWEGDRPLRFLTAVASRGGSPVISAI